MDTKPFRKIIRILVILVVVGVFIWAFFNFYTKSKVPSAPVDTKISPIVTVIGKSVQGRNIEAYAFGQGNNHLLFVGGIHGGYEWNSVLLAYKLIDYLNLNFKTLPSNLTVTVIPTANPDGIFKVVGKNGPFTALDVKSDLPLGTGRFNNNNVDLNRNFNCNWQATSTWRNNIVSAGTQVFSEPESQAIRDFVLRDKPVAAIFFHSQSNAVYASACNNGILPKTLDIMNIYSKAADYPAVKTFDSYAVTGAVEDWLASINIPAITVELKTHETIEWDKNLAGIKALFNFYSLQP